MDFDIEKILVKASGENVDKYANRVISDSDKAQIDFAFEEMFSGLSLINWMKKTTLSCAWKQSLDKIRDSIFSINEHGFVIDYIRRAVFDFRNKKLKALESSEHANEYIQTDGVDINVLESRAREKIQNGINIINNIIYSASDLSNTRRNPTQDIMINNRVCEKENEHEYERERTK